MADELITSYAEGLLTIARAEGDTKQFETELSQVAQAVDASDQLRTVVADQSVPAGRRQQMVEELLGGQASRVTTAVVSLIIGAGRGGELSAIARKVIELGAGQRGRVVAEVRSAIPLDGDQQQRLATALKASTGKDIEVNVVIDESIMGGLVTQIDDQIIDGSVKTRIGQLREAF